MLRCKKTLRIYTATTIFLMSVLPWLSPRFVAKALSVGSRVGLFIYPTEPFSYTDKVCFPVVAVKLY